MDTAYLYEQLNWSRRDTESLLNQLDMDSTVYENASWRVQDVIAHLTAWEEEALKSLDAYRQGAEYCIPDYIGVDEFNAWQYENRQELNEKTVLAQWMEVRRQIVSRLYHFTTVQWHGELLDPKGRCVSVQDFVRVLISHEAEHRADMKFLLPEDMSLAS